MNPTTKSSTPSFAAYAGVLLLIGCFSAMPSVAAECSVGTDGFSYSGSGGGFSISPTGAGAEVQTSEGSIGISTSKEDGKRENQIEISKTIDLNKDVSVTVSNTGAGVSSHNVTLSVDLEGGVSASYAFDCKAGLEAAIKAANALYGPVSSSAKKLYKSVLHEVTNLFKGKCSSHRPDQFRTLVFMTDPHHSIHLSEGYKNNSRLLKKKEVNTLTHNCMLGKWLPDSHPGLTISWDKDKKHPNLEGYIWVVDHKTGKKTPHSFYMKGSTAGEGGKNRALKIFVDGTQVHISHHAENKHALFLQFKGMVFDRVIAPKIVTKKM